MSYVVEYFPFTVSAELLTASNLAWSGGTVVTRDVRSLKHDWGRHTIVIVRTCLFRNGSWQEAAVFAAAGANSEH